MTGALFIVLGGALFLGFLALGGPAISARSENWESKPDVDKSCLEPIVRLLEDGGLDCRNHPLRKTTKSQLNL